MGWAFTVSLLVVVSEGRGWRGRWGVGGGLGKALLVLGCSGGERVGMVGVRIGRGGEGGLRLDRRGGSRGMGTGVVLVVDGDV